MTALTTDCHLLNCYIVYIYIKDVASAVSEVTTIAFFRKNDLILKG